MKTPAQYINEDAQFWIKTYKAAHDEGCAGDRYEELIASFVARLFCEHPRARLLGHNLVYCGACQAEVIVSTPGR